MKGAVVTGVSSGIGDGIAAVLIKAGWRVFGTVLDHDEAAAARRRHGERLHPLVLDVCDEDAVIAAAATVTAALGGRSLDALVNNAGIALADPLVMQPTAAFRRQIDVNLVGPFVVTKAFAPLLGARDGAPPERGRIVNMSSVCGRIGLPFLGAYAASKHGLEGMSASLRRELKLYGIAVIVVGPGLVATPIWDKAESADAGHLQGTSWAQLCKAFVAQLVRDGRTGSTPAQIGEVVLTALTAARPKPRYAPVHRKFTNWILPTRLPVRLADYFIARQAGLDTSRTNG